MPELPEVETLRRGLARRVRGRTLVHVEVRDARLRTPLAPAALAASLVGRRIVAVRRRSKYLLVDLDEEKVLVVHLGMSGRLLVTRAAVPLAPHTHVRIALDGGLELRYSDPRRFGMLFVVDRAALGQDARFATLGPEPLEPGFDVAHLVRSAAKHRRPVKTFLLDARVVAGVGNIYACEALHRAGVHPRRSVGRLSAARWEALHAALRAVLCGAVRAGGTTLQDYRRADGRAGRFQSRLRVYGREGEPCPRCRRRVRRIVQAGRSTFYCPGCQR